jgi:hypothetical protein
MTAARRECEHSNCSVIANIIIAGVRRREIALVSSSPRLRGYYLCKSLATTDSEKLE